MEIGEFFTNLWSIKGQIEILVWLEEIFLAQGKYLFYAALAVIVGAGVRGGIRSDRSGKGPLKAWVGTLDDAICGAEKTTLIMCMGFMVALVFGQVVLDFLPHHYGINWSEELATYMLIWSGFLGGSIATKDKRHLVVDIIPKLMPEGSRTRRTIERVSLVIATCYCAFLFQLSVKFVAATDKVSLSQMAVPLQIVQLIIPVTFGVMLFRFIGHIFGLITPRPESQDEIEAAKRAAQDGAGGSLEPSVVDRNIVPGNHEAMNPTPPGVTQRKKWLLPVGLLMAAGMAYVILSGFLRDDGPIGWAILLLFLILFFTGVPLFAVLGTATALCLAKFEGPNSLFVIPKEIFYTSNVFELVAIPCFVLAGSFMTNGAIAKRLIEFARAIVGWMPGGLAVTAVLACMFFAAISGSSPVTVIAIGTMMFPAMVKEGYPEKFSLGMVTSAGSLGILIPPSIPMIVYAIVGQLSPKSLFIGGIIPGLLIGGMLMGYAMLVGLRNPQIQRVPFSTREVGLRFRRGIWGVGLPIVILGGIYSGQFGITQSAAVSVAYALVVEMFIHRETKWRDLPKLMVQAAVDMGSVILVIAIAQGFAEFITTKEVPQMMAEFIRNHVDSRIGFLLVLNIALLIAGCLMDIMSAILIFTPLFLPIALSYGIDPIHLGIIFIVNLEIGYMTPPVGINLFVSSIVFNQPIGKVIRSVGPTLLIFLISLLVITYVPWLSTGLPESMGAGTGQAIDLREQQPKSMLPAPGAPAAPAGDAPPAAQSWEEMLKQLNEQTKKKAGTEDGADVEPETEDGPDPEEDPGEAPENEPEDPEEDDAEDKGDEPEEDNEPGENDGLPSLPSPGEDETD